MVLGLSEGFKKELTLIGVGYRASMSGAQLNLNLGFSHPILMDIPEGLTVQVRICNSTTMYHTSLPYRLTARFMQSS
jgi:ribosomal protein L6P/L9E